MPQISRIRIVNFTYNDGNRFIPDELYDLSSPGTGEALNSLFNLNNGGGKTVLVQLMMQPVHPKAMAGGRRIEDYFARPGDHSFILLEWNLDGSRERLLTGIAMAASAGNSGGSYGGGQSEEIQRGNRVKYYTFKTVYESRSSYSISSLELSKNENGKYVPAPFDFVREKAKASKGALVYYSSDDAVRWSQMLSEEYGIHRAEWETVIEALNRDEGGLNQYFSEARTSDRLIAKFFLPAIEHRLMGASPRGTDSSLETMLINYAGKITNKEEVIRERDSNSRLLGDLSIINGMVEELRRADSEFAARLSEAFEFDAAVRRRIAAIAEETGAVSRDIEVQENLIAHIEHEKKSKDYYIARERHAKAEAALKEADGRLNTCGAELEKKKHEEDILQCVRLFRQIREADVKIEEISRLIEERENHSEDADRIASLKYSVFVKARETREKLTKKAAELEAGIRTAEESLKASEAARERAEKELGLSKERYTKAKADLEAAKENTNARTGELRIEAVRRFDGFYPKEEVDLEKTRRLRHRDELESRIQGMEKRIEEIRSRLSGIPYERDEIREKKKASADEIENAGTELAEYDSLYERIVKICEKHSLDSRAAFNGNLHDTVRKECEFTAAGIAAAKHDRQELEKKKEAAEEGCLHILPEILKYVQSTGVHCRTGEEYLCVLKEDGSLSEEETGKILGAFPEFAYALLFGTKKEIQRLLSAGNAGWLPASVPLFTMEQVDRIFACSRDGSDRDGKDGISKGTFLAACDSRLFADKAGWIRRAEEEISSLDGRLVYLEGHLQEAEEEKSVTDEFHYPEEWRTEQEGRIQSLKQGCGRLQAKLLELDKEEESLQKERNGQQEKLEGTRGELKETDVWLTSFSGLERMMSREIELSDAVQRAYGEKSRAEKARKEACDEFTGREKALETLEREKENNDDSIKRADSIMEQVGQAAESAVIEGDLELLFSQYEALSSSLDKSLRKLNADLNKAQEEKRRNKEELDAYHDCKEADYAGLDYTQASLQKEILRAKSECQKMEEKKEKLQSIFNERNKEFGAAEGGLEQARTSLEAFGGAPLPQGEIGEAFKERSQNAEKTIRFLREKTGKFSEEKSLLDKVLGQAEELLGPFKEDSAGSSSSAVLLGETPDAQWKGIREALKSSSRKRSDRTDKLHEKLNKMAVEYKGNVLAEIASKLELVRGMIEEGGRMGRDGLYMAGESISAMTASIEKINSRIDTDLREIENDFQDIVNQCFLQGKRMYTDLRIIAASSKAHIYEGKPQTQMVKMDLPEEKEISEEASRLSIEREIKQGADEIREMIKSGAEEKQIRRRAKAIVGSERLLHRYIRMESISVKVYKIDLNRANSSYKKWEDTLTQSSGAEKFVAFFSVILTLMNYTRSSSGLSPSGRKAKSVLILDNPFGKITSAHLLRPMFDIAKHFSVQLICLSDINKSDVIGCFDCVIKLLIKTQKLSNFEIMTHEGNERIEHGYYKIMNGQLSLF